MMQFSRWIASKAAPEYADARQVEARARIGLLEGWSSVGLNAGLFLLKGALSLMTGSISLAADALHTLADCLTSLVVVFGFRMARKPADREHPFGHGRMESIATLIIGVLLAMVALEMFRASVERLVNPRPVRVSAWMIAVLGFTLIVKELQARFAEDLSRLIGSTTLHADAWHHRSDVLATGLVIVAFAGTYWGLWWLDGAMGLGVAGIIAWAAGDAMHHAIDPLLGEPAPRVVYEEIECIARSEAGVRGVHDILVHRYGETNIISLHIEVSDKETPIRLHEMSEEIEDKLAARFPGHATVHVDPINQDHEHYGAVKRIVSEMIAEDRCAVSFHDLRLLGGSRRFKVAFDVVGGADFCEVGQVELRERIEQRLKKGFPLARVVMNVEPPYFHDLRQEAGEEGAGERGRDRRQTKAGTDRFETRG